MVFVSFLLKKKYFCFFSRKEVYISNFRTTHYCCKSGKDKIFLNAPVIIIIHTPKIPKFSLIDTSIAFTYGDLAAHTLGLGTCWMGFATNSLYKNARAKKYFNIPKDNIITGVITLGYPSIKYRKIPPRKAKHVQWFE